MRQEDLSEEEQPILGLDFGGSNCAAAYHYKNKIGLVISEESLDDFNSKAMPTLVGFDKEGKFIVGKQAKKELNNSSATVIENLKKKIFENTKIKYKDKELRPQLLISELFNTLKKKAELELGIIIKKCVLTTPANFGQKTKTILRQAASLAGLTTLRIITEPTSAALCHSKKRNSRPHSCLIVDLGSLTADMTICHISKDFIDIETTAGDPNCGFNTVDKKIAQLIKEEIKLKSKIEKFSAAEEKQILELSEKLKIEFCIRQTNIIVKRPLIINNQRILLNFVFTEEKMSKALQDYLSGVRGIYSKLFKNSIYHEREIDRLILVGGPASSNYLKNKINEIMDIPLEKNTDAIFSVCMGAALYGAMICNYTEEDTILSDITSLSLGVETQNDINEVIIPSNSRLPCARRMEFTTSEDFQKCAKITVLEGERLLAPYCKKLGTYILDNIAYGLKGAPVIEVEFNIDRDGILEVKVTDLNTLAQKKGVLQISEALTYTEKKELEEISVKARKEDLQTINKLKTAESMREMTKFFQLNKDWFFKDASFLEVYNKALEALNETPVNYDKIFELKVPLEKKYYDYMILVNQEAKKNGSDIKKLI